MSRLSARLASAAAAVAVLVAILSGCVAQLDSADPIGPQIVGPSIPLHPPLSATDYEYTLTLSCQCPDSGVPVRVTVEDNTPTRAVYLEASSRHEAGELAENDKLLVTINDVIDAANDASAFNIDEDWPTNQDWPNRVNVDPLENTADEEYGFRISDVALAT